MGLRWLAAAVLLAGCTQQIVQEVDCTRCMTTFKVDGEVVQVSTGPTTLVLPEEPGDYSAWVLARGPHTYRAYWRMGLTEVDIIAEQTWELNFPQEQVTGHLFGLGD